MSLTSLIGEYSVVIKIEVSNLERSTDWYVNKLQLEVDTAFDAQTWRQLIIPDNPNVVIGLHLNQGGDGVGGKKVTFVVTDIRVAHEALLRQGVDVQPVVDIEGSVKLAFFEDPDGNVLGLRENIPR